MEFNIRKILNLDLDAENLRKNNILLLENKRLELDKELEKMKIEAELKFQEKKHRSIRDILEKAEEEANRISLEKEEYLLAMKEKYKLLKEKIVEDIFVKLIESEEE